MDISLAHKLNRQKLRQWAGPRSFQRGEDYSEDDRVRIVAEDERTFTAKVQGSRSYRVQIHIQAKEIQYACNCPLGIEQIFCKHLVAAGLTWIDQESENKNRGNKMVRSKPKVTIKDIRSYLLAQDK